MLSRAWLLPMANLLITLVLYTMMISKVVTSGPPKVPTQLSAEGAAKELVNLCGLFSIHYRIAVNDSSLTTGPIRERCSNYHILSYLRARAMMFAVEEINNRSDLLRNISLTYEIRDICNRKSIGLQACMDCLRLVNTTGGSQTYSPAELPRSADPSLVIIGPDTSESAITMADFLQIFGVPLISYSATSTLLSNRDKYRTFFRTVPDDGYQTVVIADIIRHYGWDWVGIIAVDNSYGRSAMSDFLFHASKRGVCVAFQLVVGETMSNGDMQRFFRELESFPELEVIVAFTYTKTLLPFLDRAEMNSTPINALTWISTDVWTDIASRDFRIIGNVLMVTVENTEVPGFHSYLGRLNPFLEEFDDDPWLREIWEGEFGCQIVSPVDWDSPCARHTLLENEKTANAAMSFTIYRVYLAVYAVAHALGDIESCAESQGLLAKGRCPSIRSVEPWQLMKYLMSVNFTAGNNGRYVSFNKDGGIVDTFKVMQWQRCDEDVDDSCQVVRFVEIGRHKDGVLYINDSLSRWYDDDTNPNTPPSGVCQSPCPPGTRKVSRDGLPVCCFQCTRCPEGSVTNTSGELVCMQCPQGTWSNEKRSLCYNKSKDVLYWGEPVSIIIMCFCVLGLICTAMMLVTLTVYNNTAIVRASNREISYCLLFLLLVSFLEPFLYIGMPVTWSCNFRIALHSLNNTGVLAIFVVKTRRILDVFDTSWRGFSLRSRLRRTGLQVMIIGVLILIQGIIVSVYLVVQPSKVLLDKNISNSKVYVQCDSAVLAFVAMYSYNTILAGICFVFSFRARKIPENFHETRYITVAMLFYMVIWVVSLPTYFSTTGKLQALMQIISVLLTNYLILGFMFLPKCYIIFITPERNTTQSIREQACGFRMGEINNTLVVQMDGEARRPSSRLSASDHDGQGNHS